MTGTGTFDHINAVISTFPLGLSDRHFFKPAGRQGNQPPAESDF